METRSCHSNQSSYPTGIKNNIHVTFGTGQCPKQVCHVSASSSLRFLRGRLLIFFSENLPFMSPRQPIKSSDLYKSHMKDGGLLNYNLCKKNIPNDLAEIVNFHFSHYKSMETLSCNSNHRNKKHNFVEGNILNKYAKFWLHPPYGF